MQMADYGAWSVAVPQLAFLATEAIVQGSATIPAVASPQPTDTQQPADSATPTLPPTETETPSPTAELATEAATLEPPTETPTQESPTEAPPTFPPAPSRTLPAFMPTVTPPPFTPLPAAPVMGYHTVQPGETMFCIARGYGVLPGAIAQANGLSQTFLVSSGQVLKIPEVQWTKIAAGPVCATQFPSIYPGLLVPTATPAASSMPSGSPLVVHLDYHCFANCSGKDGNYELHMDVIASGGVQPYAYTPAQSYDLSLPHCVNGQGLAAVASADGQTAQAAWTYLDNACP
jgi:LysM repeat protein